MREHSEAERAFVALAEDWAICVRCDTAFDASDIEDRHDGRAHCHVCAMRNCISLLDRRPQIVAICQTRGYTEPDWSVVERKIDELLTEVLNDGPNH